MRRPKEQPRGFRNCNPLNIRIGNTWLGERNDPDENEFEQFVSMVYGIRAGFVILRRYIRRYHINTIRLIVSRWAPSSENNTNAYVDTVAKRMKSNPDAEIRFEDRDTMCSLVDAMIFVENGMTCDLGVIKKAYDAT